MHTTSLEVSKKLKEAGYWRFDLEYYWFRGDNTPTPLTQARESDLWNSSHCWPALTLGELIRELPDGYAISRKDGKYYIHDLSNLIQEDKDGNMMLLDGWVELICEEIESAEDAAGEALIALLKKGKTT